VSRQAVNFILDAAMLLVFTALLASASILQFVFPAATRADGCSLWGLTFEGWLRVQTVCLAVLMFGVLLHLILHWTWACGFVASRMSKWTGKKVGTNEATRTLYGVCTLIGVLTALGALLMAAELMLKTPAQAAPTTLRADSGGGTAG